MVTMSDEPMPSEGGDLFVIFLMCCIVVAGFVAAVVAQVVELVR